MKTLHIAPGRSAGGSLSTALRDMNEPADVLSFFDDLSCGPIDAGGPSEREIWWNQFYDEAIYNVEYREFWERVTTATDRLVVWFSRHSAMELSFFLAWVNRLGERPYQIIDATGQCLRSNAPDGSIVLSKTIQSVSLLPPYALRKLLGTERPMTPQERDSGRRQWQHLRRENAPFRIVTEEGLVSASIDHFDPLLLAQATSEWQQVALVVGSTMGTTPILTSRSVISCC